MKEKGILKLKTINKARMMHYIVENNNLYMLTLNDSAKITDINKDNNVEVFFDLKSDEKTDGKITIINDEEKVKYYFDKMLNENNTHFKTFDNRLVVLELTLN